MLPNKPRSVRRINDRRVLNGIFWVLRAGTPWRDLPENYGHRTTCYNRFVRWRRAGVWDQIMNAPAAGLRLATASEASFRLASRACGCPAIPVKINGEFMNYWQVGHSW